LKTFANQNKGNKGAKMKTLTAFIVLPLILIAGIAFAQPPDLTGRWTYKLEVMDSDGMDYKETGVFIIDTQVDLTDTKSLISGCTKSDFGGEDKGQYFSGALVGKNVYITFPSSTIKGKLKKNGMSLVSQVFNTEETHAQTGVGNARWQSNDLTNDICFPMSDPEPR
jgi:hypothetical protein